MKDIFFDIVKHTASIGFFDLAKINGTDKKTEIKAGDKGGDNLSVLLEAELKSPNKGLVGEIGFGNLSVLNGITSLYNKDGATVKVDTNEDGVPSYIRFSDADGNNDSYRLMNISLIDDALPAEPANVKWEITFKPSKSKIIEMGAKASVYSSIDPFFTAKTISSDDANDVIFTFGNIADTHGKMLFTGGVKKSMNESMRFPIDKFLSILKLGIGAPDTNVTVHFSQFACMITIDNSVGTYNYVLLGHRE